ncbi:MAG TPA: hypothetical protein VEL51_21980 [Vicinamibacterales bacterium]|nr:hypothetical protein [Vicinamibacterales bacterium]
MKAAVHNRFIIDCDTARDKGVRVMNNRSLFRALAIAALVLTSAAAIGIGAYNAGMAQGIAASGRLIAAPPAGAAPYVYVWPRPWGFGFFPFFPLLFIFLFFFVMRGLFWRGPWRGGWRDRYDGVPPAFDEWHKRAHAAQTGPSRPTDSTT